VRPRVWLLVALAVASGVVLLRQPRTAGDVLATTTCPFRGPPVVVIRAGIDVADTLAVRVHEEVHVAQCRALGAVRYRLTNLTGAGKLSLEVPAYCAAAESRIRSGWARRTARERFVDDLQSAMSGIADSADLSHAVLEGCPF
jgi:hypothetical protein